MSSMFGKGGAHAIELNVLESNERAIRFYERNGFRKVYKHYEYYILEDGPRTGFLMECRLPSGLAQEGPWRYFWAIWDGGEQLLHAVVTSISSIPFRIYHSVASLRRSSRAGAKSGDDVV